MIFDVYHPHEADLRSISVHELLPQQEPFVMVDSLVHFDEKLTETEMLVSPKNMFVEDGHFTPTGLMENIAQTCATRIGYVNKYILQKNIQIGYIGAIRNLEIIETPIVGSLITTRIKVLEEVFGMILAHAEVECNNHIIVSAEMKIAIAKGGKR